MYLMFICGVLIGSILLIKLEIILIMIFCLMGILFPSFSIVFNVIATIVGLILVIGHIKTTIGLTHELSDPTFRYEQLLIKKGVIEDAVSTINSFTQGLIFRFKKEVVFIKEVASFNFKY